MMQIAACRPYHARTVGTSLLRMPDGKSAFKLYYLSIVGRDTPERYEWGLSPLSQRQFEEALLQGGHEGVGFITAFPHITKVFRFSPYIETVLDVRAYQTQGMSPLDISRIDGSHEFACYAEAIIAAEEYRVWAEAPTVGEYLAFRCAEAEFPVERNTKLSAYWEQT